MSHRENVRALRTELTEDLGLPAEVRSLLREHRELLERKPFPVGTKRKWFDGVYQKQYDGSWARVPDPSERPEPKTREALVALKPPTARKTATFTRGLGLEFSTAMHDVFDVSKPMAEREGRVRALLMSVVGDYGMVSRDASLGLSARNVFKVDSSEACRNGLGFHHWDGSIALSPDIYRGARDFLDRRAGNLPAQSGSWTDPELLGMKTFVHEQCHGCSPIQKQLYHGEMAAFEEGTTELSARQVMTETFGVKPDVFAARHRHVGTYHDECEQIHQAVLVAMLKTGVLTGDRTDTRWMPSAPGYLEGLIAAAAIKMRGPVGGRGDEVTDGSQAYRRFANGLPIPKLLFAEAAAAQSTGGTVVNPGALEEKFQRQVVEELHTRLRRLGALRDMKDELDALQTWHSKLTNAVAQAVLDGNLTREQASEKFREQGAEYDRAVAEIRAKYDLKAESKMDPRTPYDLARNDIPGALALVKKLKAQGRLTPEVVQVLVKLQDHPAALTKALAPYLKR